MKVMCFAQGHTGHTARRQWSRGLNPVLLDPDPKSSSIPRSPAGLHHCCLAAGGRASEATVHTPALLWDLPFTYLLLLGELIDFVMGAFESLP